MICFISLRPVCVFSICQTYRGTHPSCHPQKNSPRHGVKKKKQSPRTPPMSGTRRISHPVLQYSLPSDHPVVNKSLLSTGQSCPLLPKFVRYPKFGDFRK